MAIYSALPRRSLLRDRPVGHRALDDEGGRGFGLMGGFPFLREFPGRGDRGAGGQHPTELLAPKGIIGAVDVGVFLKRGASASTSPPTDAPSGPAFTSLRRALV